jgi:pimeloyl-ACP methyl ester carboxylesterase
MPNVRVNGCDFFYADDDFVDPWRAHDTVFLQPWLLGNHTRFRSWVPALAAEYRVIRMDRRGLGLSSVSGRDDEFTLDQMLDDFDAVLDAIGIDAVHYVGESTGGMLGIAFAARYPQRVKTLVLCATPASLTATAPGFAIDGVGDGPTAVMAMGSQEYARTLAERASRGASTEGAHEIRERWEHVARMQPRTIAAIIRMATDTRFDITALLPQVQAPTLLLTPGASEVLTADGQPAMSELIPHCEQVIFANAAHTIFFDYRQHCIDLARDFIRRHTGYDG